MRGKALNDKEIDQILYLYSMNKDTSLVLKPVVKFYYSSFLWTEGGIWVRVTEGKPVVLDSTV